MAFPIAHSLAGYLIYRTGRQVGKIPGKSWRQALLFSVLASAADFDYLPGVLVGRPNLFHHTVTHSLAAALACGLLVALIASLWKKRPFFKMFLISSAVYFSHIAVDLFSPWPTPVFWPLQPVDLAAQFQIFQSLPLCGEGVKNFACDLLRHSSDISRFWREISYLGLALTFFLSRATLRLLFTRPQRRTIFTCAENGSAGRKIGALSPLPS